MSWINTPGMITVMLMLVPNIVYAFKRRDVENHCSSFAMNLVEQVGRYGSMFLMAFNIGILEAGFGSKTCFLVWMVSMIVLLLAYWVGWFLYFRNSRPAYALTLAIIPSMIFMLSGMLMRHWLLLPFAVLFAVGHIHVTCRNAFGSQKGEGNADV